VEKKGGGKVSENRSIPLIVREIKQNTDASKDREPEVKGRGQGQRGGEGHTSKGAGCKTGTWFSKTRRF